MWTKVLGAMFVVLVALLFGILQHRDAQIRRMEDRIAELQWERCIETQKAEMWRETAQPGVYGPARKENELRKLPWWLCTEILYEGNLTPYPYYVEGSDEDLRPDGKDWPNGN